MADRKVIRSELVIPLPFISNDLADVMSEADHQSLLGSIQSQMDKEYLYVSVTIDSLRWGFFEGATSLSGQTIL